eukprot:1157964-Pelagomonas_calceolata.AAC.3
MHVGCSRCAVLLSERVSRAPVYAVPFPMHSCLPEVDVRVTQGQQRLSLWFALVLLEGSTHVVRVRCCGGLPPKIPGSPQAL